MENFPKNESAHDKKTTWEKLREQVKAIGIVLPLAVNQANAVENPFEMEPFYGKEVATAPTTERGETIGESENFSPEEWKLATTYRHHALWGENERTTIYSIFKDGKVVQVPGETMLGEQGGLSDMRPQTKNLPESLQKIIIHQHPIITGYSGAYQKITGQYDVQKQSPEERDRTKVEEKILIEKIRHGEVLSAWPPSATDIATAVFNKERIARVVDANGVWTFSIDKTSEKGRDLMSRGKLMEVFYQKLKSAGYDKSDYEHYMEELKNMKNDPNYDTPNGLPDFLTAKTKAEKEAKMFLLGDLEPELREDYKKHQINVAHPTENRAEWENSIKDFVSYCKNLGLRVNYTPFK